MIYIEARTGWHRHPSTIASAPYEKVLRLTVKALGDDPAQLPHLLQSRMPATAGPSPTRSPTSPAATTP